MYCQIQSAALSGINAYPVLVEVDISNGLPCFNMVGLLGNEIKEAKERVITAIKNTNIAIPASKITISLSPADRHKDGAAFDLPIAVGILYALKQFPNGPDTDTLFLGELGLNGELRPIKGVLPIIQEAVKHGIKKCILPSANALEASVVPKVTIYYAENLSSVVSFLQAPEENMLPIEPFHPEASDSSFFSLDSDLDYSQVKGQPLAKRAAMISAAGFHSLLMTGPPGSGKSMIAKRLPGILPPMTLDESLEVSAIYSVAGKLDVTNPLIRHRRLQSPHHSLSIPALIGGGNRSTPGIISLAHRSVLFLDELTEFSRLALDSLRQPLEEHQVTIAKNHYINTYPADFLLVAAMNPCPCGYYPDRNRCRCSEPQIHKYMGKISGPILDRIDLCVELHPVEIDGLQNTEKSESSNDMRKKVQKARIIQEERFKNTNYRFNSDIDASDIETYCHLGPKEKEYMHKIYQTLKLSARSYHRILKVARTIADLDNSENIQISHLTEAVIFRPTLEYWM